MDVLQYIGRSSKGRLEEWQLGRQSGSGLRTCCNGQEWAAPGAGFCSRAGQGGLHFTGASPSTVLQAVGQHVQRVQLCSVNRPLPTKVTRRAKVRGRQLWQRPHATAQPTRQYWSEQVIISKPGPLNALALLACTVESSPVT